MTNATRVHFKGISKQDNFTRVFYIAYNESFCTLEVTSFEDGIATITVIEICDIIDLARIIEGCFSEESNFCVEVISAYGDQTATLTGIRFEFNGAVVDVTKENADADSIYREWEARMDAKAEMLRREREAWLQTPEGQKYLADKKEKEEQRKITEQMVDRIDEESEMEFKGEEGKAMWEYIVEINSKNSYGNDIVTVARRWAKVMQKFIAEGNTVESIAWKAFTLADNGDTSGFMYGCAIDALAKSWKYGEELRKWHNTDYGYVGDGIVNPAIIAIEVG